MENNDGASNDGVPPDELPDSAPSGDIQDGVSNAGASDPTIEMGTAIGSQFTPDPPPPPPPPANPANPAPPVVAPPTTESTWGTVTPSAPTPSAPVAPGAASTWSSTTQPAGVPPAGTPNVDGSMGYNTPDQSIEYPMAGAVAGDAPKGSSKLPWIFAVVAAVLLLGGGGFFAVSAFGASGGAETPEDAIDTMLAAMGEEDFVSIAELMEPSERRTLAEPALTELLPELKRLGVLDESADAADVEGIDLVFTDVEYRVENLVGVDDIAHVYLTGGEVSTTINSADLPFTTDVDTSELDQQDSQTIEETETPVVFVERDGRWYFSMWFTIAEAARLEADERLPSVDEQPASVPSDSPDAAIEGLFTSMVDFDLESMIGHMDPDEMAVLYRYSPLFLDEAQAELDDLRNELINESFTWNMTNFDFDVDESGDDAVVTMRGFTLEIASPDFEFEVTYSRDLLTGELNFDGLVGSMAASTTQFDIEGTADGSTFDAGLSVDPENYTISGSVRAEGDSFEGELVLDENGGCSRYEVTGTDGTNESGCLEDEADIEGIGPILEAMEEWPDEFPGVSFRARQTDGGWYVSPIGTMFDGVITALEDLEEGDFEDVFNPVADIAGDTITDPLDILNDVEDAVTDGGSDEVLGGFNDPVSEDVTDIAVADGEVSDFNGEINSGGFDTFLINLEAGAAVVLTAQAEGSGLDTILTVLDPAGGQVAYNDDAEINNGLSSGVDSQVVVFAGEAGVYAIEVAGFGSSDGSYVLTVDRASDGIVDDEGETIVDDAGAEPFLEDVTPVDVAPNQTAQFVGSLDDPDGVDSFDLTLGAGETVTISVEADATSDLDSVATVYGPNNIELGRNDDAGANAGLGSSRDSQVTISTEVAGLHSIEVSSWIGNSSGAYTVTIERGAEGQTATDDTTPDGPANAGAIVVAPGSTEVFQGVVEEDQIYDIELAAGDALVITVEANDALALDPVVELRLDGLEIGRNDDAADSTAVADNFDSQLLVTATSAGTHQIVVSGFALSTGAFTMTVERG